MEYKALHSKNIIFLEYASIMPCFFRAISGSIDKRKPDGVPPGFIYLKNKKFLISFPVFLVFPVSEAILCVTA